MKSVAPISLVQPNPIHPLSPRNALMQRVLDAALEFAPDRPYRAPGPPPSKAFAEGYSTWLINKLLHDLKTTFWKDLYVYRRILSDVLEKKSKAHVTALVGLPGVGKTITAQKIVEILQPNSTEANQDPIKSSTHLPVYIDLKKYANTFHSLEPTSENFSNKIYQQLSQCIAIESINLIDNPITRRILQEATARYALDVDVRENLYQMLSQALIEQAGESQLYIVLDSVDNLSLLQQQIALDYLFGLSSNLQAPCLLPIRTANLQRFSETAWRTDFMDVVEFDSEDEVNESDHFEALSARGESLNYVTTRLNSTTFSTPDDRISVYRERSSHILRDILNRRLYKVFTFQELSQFLPSLPGSGDRISSNDYLIEFSKVADAITSELVRSNGMFEAVNRSIRDCLIVVNGIVTWTLNGSQPGFSIEEGWQNPQVIRNMFFRYLTTAKDVHKAKELPESERLERSSLWELPLRDSTWKEEHALRALHLRILEFLKHFRANEGHGIPKSAIHSHFNLFGYSVTEIDKALVDLEQPAAESALGLIWIRQFARKEDEVCVLPAGRFYYERLAVSLEHLFWCWAMTECVSRNRERASDSQITYARFVADKNRASVGIKIIRDKLFEIFEDEIRSIKDTRKFSQEVRDAYFSVHLANGHLLCRLLDFVRKHILSLSDNDDELEESLAELSSKIDTTFRQN